MSNTSATLLSDAPAASRRALFCVGDTVRVRTGISDPDFPGNPLDGWVGRIVERDDTPVPVQYLVQWDEKTLVRMWPDCRESCELEGFAFDRMWLLEDDLAPLPQGHDS